MISAEALHLGPLMLPWSLLIILGAIVLTLVCGRIYGKKMAWQNDAQQRFNDSIWTSFCIGLLVARIVFVLFHIDDYLASPIDIVKIQDKGFEIYSGAMAGVAWFLWKNRALTSKFKLLLVGSFVAVIILGFGLKFISNRQQNYPDLSFSILDHSQTQQEMPTLAMSSFKGQPTIVNLWASWCPPCHREMPVLAKAHHQHPNVNFVMLNQGEDAQTIADYLNRYSFNFKYVLLDPYGKMGEQMNMYGLPSTLFFNADGVLVARHMGELTSATLNQYLEKISTSP